MCEGFDVLRFFHGEAFYATLRRYRVMILNPLVRQEVSNMQ